MRRNVAGPYPNATVQRRSSCRSLRSSSRRNPSTRWAGSSASDVGHVVDRRVDEAALGDPAPDVVLDERDPPFQRRALGQLAELLDEAPTVGAEEVLHEDALVADLVHGGTEGRSRVAGPEPYADRLEPLESVERLERPALHLGPADPDRPVVKPDHVDARVGDQVVGHVGVDDPRQREPVPEVVGHGDGAEPGGGSTRSSVTAPF